MQSTIKPCPNPEETFQEFKFYVGQKVWLTVDGYNSLRGPYLIETAISGGKYTLCHRNGDKVDEYGEVSEDDLVASEG